MSDPQKPHRHTGDDKEQPPLIPPPRAAADDGPPFVFKRGVPIPRDSGADNNGRGRGSGYQSTRPPQEPNGRSPYDEEGSALRWAKPVAEEPSGEPEPPHLRPAMWPDRSPHSHAERHLRAASDEESDLGIPHPMSDEAPGLPESGLPADQGPPVGETPVEPPPPLDHGLLRALLGAWALAACSAEETNAVEAHLTDCAPCAGEALRLRDAVALLHPEDSLDLNPRLRGRVLESALGRRPARIPIPSWAAPFDAETARLDALLRDMADAEWRAPVTLRWFEGDRPRARTATVAEVIGHLMAVDGLVGGVLSLPDPLVEGGAVQAEEQYSLLRPAQRTEAYWRSSAAGDGQGVRGPWRDQTHALVRAAGMLGPSLADRPVSGLDLPLRDAFLDRAFECWMHACDIAAAVDYPHPPPEGGHLHQLVELATRSLPFVLATRRQSGLAAPPRELTIAGEPGRTLHLEVEGSGGGDWYIPLDSPGSTGSADSAVAHVALDGVEFCHLVAGHVSPLDAAAGAEGDSEAVRDVLFATASMSRL